MTQITTRAGKGSPLTWNEVDANFTYLDNQVLSIKDYGAIGDGIINDTAAFTAFEIDYPGYNLDLQGLTFNVSTIPTGARYFNGNFIAGSTRLSLRRNKLDNPMDGQSWVAIGDTQTHYWLFDMVYIPGTTSTTGRLILVVKPAWSHALSTNTPINILFSDDLGLTWENERTIYSASGYDIADARGGLMASGRIGFLLYLRDSIGNSYRNDFVYSDDSGTTWSSIASVVASPNGRFPYGEMFTYPTAVGGDDTNGFIVYCYSGGIIYAAKTVDNGATWSMVATGLNQSGFAEMAVVRVNSDNKWIGFIRESNTNLYVSTSTNMTTWNTPVDTGINLESNPVYAVVDNGRLFVYLTLRDFGGSVLGAQNETIVYEEDPNAVFNASNLVIKAPRVAFTGVDRCLGYFNMVKVDQDFVWSYVCSEYDASTLLAAPSNIALGTTRKIATVSQGYVDGVSSQPNLLRNGTFQLWTRGTTFGPTSSNVNVADGWTVQPSGATVTVTRVDVSVEDSRQLPFNPRYGMNIVSSTPDDFTGFAQKFFGVEELYRFAETPVTIQIWGKGDVPGQLYSYIELNYGSGGSTADTKTLNFYLTESADNIWKGTLTMVTDSLVGKTIGTDPYVKIAIATRDTGSWNATVFAVKAEFGTKATRLLPMDIQSEKTRCARTVQSIILESADALGCGTATSAINVFGVFHYPQMIKTPTPSILNGTYADLEVYPGSVAGTSFGPSSSGSSVTGFNIGSTGLTTGSAYVVRAISGANIAILLDCE